MTPYQVQSAVGEFYFSISNNKGNESAQKFSVELFSKLLSQIENKSVDIPEIFTKPEYTPFLIKLKFISGEIGLSNICTAYCNHARLFCNN